MDWEWRILDPLGGEEWLEFMCDAREFYYPTSTPRGLETACFEIPNSKVTVHRFVVSSGDRFFWIHTNSGGYRKHTPDITVSPTLTPSETDLIQRHFQHLTNLTVSF
jgi:hypothetical protein